MDLGTIKGLLDLFSFKFLVKYEVTDLVQIQELPARKIEK